MVDIHSHILHGLDDGAQTFEESLEMVRIAAGSGTTDIVATPHANPEFQFQPEVIRERAAALAAAIAQDAVQVRIHTGCDFHLEYDNIQDALLCPTKYTINQRSYLLVEFSDLLIFSTTDDILQRLRTAGMLPIITHLQKRIADLTRWVNSGCCVQVTAQSLLGRFGKAAREFAGELMRRDLVHFLASDAHDARDRTPSLRDAYEHVAAKWGERRAQRLCIENPRAVLTGELLEIEELEEPAPRRKWYRFWT
jgi:protein-tyrosine phosphatase